MGLVATLIGLAISSVVTGLLVWLGVKLTGESGSVLALMLAALLSGVAGLLPMVGWIASIVVLLYCVKLWTSANGWFDCLFAVVVAWGIGNIGAVVLMGLL